MYTISSNFCLFSLLPQAKRKKKEEKREKERNFTELINSSTSRICCAFISRSIRSCSWRRNFSCCLRTRARSFSLCRSSTVKKCANTTGYCQPLVHHIASYSLSAGQQVYVFVCVCSCVCVCVCVTSVRLATLQQNICMFQLSHNPRSRVKVIQTDIKM